MTFREILQTRSLRFWILTGMVVALVPVLTASIAGFILLNQSVIGSFRDVADRQRTEIVPAQHVGLALWDAATSVDEFVEDGNSAHQGAFRAARTDIDAALAGLIASVDTEPVVKSLITRAKDEWAIAEASGGELMSVLRPAGDPRSIEAVERFDGAIRSASDSLDAGIEHLEDDIAEDLAAANLGYERALWLAGIGAGVCLLMIVAGVLLIGRVMAASVDRLVDGAIRFAEGDRTHRIDVRVPPELRRVANEFNRMITKIHAYEDVLTDRALRDVLTGLPNRRAFEEAVARNWERAQQLGEPFSVLQIDIDHFKNINDAYGHTVGDEVLRRVADTVAKQLRAAHPVFRTGGEEFVVIVPNAGLSSATLIADRLRTAVAVTSPLSDLEISVTISIGAADSTGFETSDDMIRAADAALYEAKAQGRNRVVASGAGDQAAA